MQPALKEILPRWEVGFLISVFAVGFFITLLSVAVMVSDASAEETYCREYQTEVTVARKQQEAYGTVCRKPDGTWKIQRDAEGSTRLPLAPAKRAVASPSIIVLSTREIEALYVDGEMVLLEDWEEDRETLFYEGPMTIIIEVTDEDDIFIVEEPEHIVIVEGETENEVIILD